MSLLVVGSIALDTIKTPFGQVKEGLGGSATYFSMAARHLTDVNLVAVVGQDFPEEYINMFQDKGIDITGLQTAKGKTFRWIGEYGFDLNDAQTIDTQLNVFRDFNPKLPPKYMYSEFVFLANIDPDLQRQILDQVESPGLVACDTMNYWIENKPDSLRAVIRRADIVTINESEARQLTKEPNLVKASKKILSWGPRILIIKRGEYGVLMFSNDSVFSAPAYPLEELYDPTGAGDSFAGGLMGFLANIGKSDETLMNFRFAKRYENTLIRHSGESRNLGFTDETAIRKGIIMGSVMASFCVEAFTPKRLIDLKPKEIKDRFSEFKKLTFFEDLTEIV
ncbi:sugar kinase [bacterium]|nr:sugar kinase [bacterium]